MSGWGGFIGRTAVRKVVYVLVGLALAAVLGAVGVKASTSEGPAAPAVAFQVPCVGPDDPAGCDPLETPAPTASPTATPSPVVVALVDEDRARLDALHADAAGALSVQAYGLGLTVFLLGAIAVAVGLRR